MNLNLEVGNIVQNKLFLGYLMTAYDDTISSVETIYEKLKGITDKNRIYAFIDKCVEFKYLFLDFKEGMAKEVNTLYTLPLNAPVVADDNFGKEKTINLINDVLMNKECRWKNGLTMNLGTAKLYTRESVLLMYDNIYNLYLRYVPLVNDMQNGKDPFDRLFAIEKESIFNSIKENGYYRLGDKAFLIQNKRKYQFVYFVQEIQEQELIAYFTARKEKKRVKKPKELVLTNITCYTNVNEEVFKEFFRNCALLTAELDG